MKKFFIILLTLTLIMIAGCMPKKSQSPEDFAFPEAKFTMSKNEVNVGEPIVFDVYLSVEGEPISDADRVEYEIWHESEADGKHESIEVKSGDKDGHYVLEKSFEKPGTYYLYYHADAMGLHLMEKFDFVVK